MIVIGATVAGLVGVLTFHTKPARLGLGVLPGASQSSASPTSSVAAGPPPTSGSSSPPGVAAAGSTTTTIPPTNQTATGEAVNYNFGVLSVSVTVSGTKITNVGIASLDDGGNPRSQSIDQQAIPLLKQQAIQAQSANIQGVSGASYTSAGFQQSLQSALSKLNFK
jgi:uncharacterized protein with FMN-binding domain